MFKEKSGCDSLKFFCSKISGDFKDLFYKYLFGDIEITNRNIAFRLESKTVNYWKPLILDGQKRSILDVWLGSEIVSDI